MYHWPTVLEKVGSYVLIGTRGEGLVIINIQTFYLKRFEFSALDNDILKIEILSSKLRINDSKEIDLPHF